MTSADARKMSVLAAIEGALGVELDRTAEDPRLPSGRRLIVVYSKPQHDGRDFFIGLPVRLRSDDALVVALGDDDVVFPAAEWLLQYSSAFSQSNDGRPNPRFRRVDDDLVLSVSSLGLLLSVAELVGNYASLAGVATILPVASGDLGRPFVKPTPRPSRHREPFSVDPDIVDRGTQAHADTLIALAEFVTDAGQTPREAKAGEPLFDLAWLDGEVTFVAEVKSLTTVNEERQLRLGLGQVLRYRHLMEASGRECVAVLAVEREPADSNWLSLCHSLDVRLAWPGAFDTLAS